MKHSLYLVLLSASLAAVTTPAHAALRLASLHTPVVVSFSALTAPAIWATATPVDGQLNSSTWAAHSEGAPATTSAVFGVDQTGGQGSSTGSETAAGTYAFTVGDGSTALGVQPTASFWSPGMFTLRLQNNTGTTVTALNVHWTTWTFNDQDRANDFRFLFSSDNLTYASAESALTVVSPTLADTAPATWSSTPRSMTLNNLSLNEGASYYLRWSGDDVGGTGSRDEFAFNALRITPVPEPATTGLLALASACLLRRRRQP